MFLSLPVNFNYGNSKKGWRDFELKELLKSQGSSYQKKELHSCFNSFEEMYLNDDRFKNLNVVSLRSSAIIEDNQGAFVIRFYKKEINNETLYFIETGQYGGYIKYKGITIYISLSQKYNTTVLHHLVSYANNITIDSEEIAVGLKSNTNELDYILSFMFLQKLERAAVLGIPKQYKQINERLSSAKGKVNFNNFIKKDVPFEGKISVIYRDRLEIQEIIDVLYYALHLIKEKYSSQSLFKVRNIYNELLSKYSKIKPKHATIFKARKHSVLGNPLYAQFRKVLELAEIVIKNLSLINDSHNSKEVSGNLYNTSELFELYIEKILVANLKSWKVEAQKEITVYKNQFYQRKLIPDFVLYSPEKDMYVVLDAKFKTMNYSYYDVDREDVFQVHTYSYYYHNKSIFSGLIYPLQVENYLDNQYFSKMLDKHDTNFGILGVELNSISTIKSIKKSEIHFLGQLNQISINKTN